MIMSKYFVVNDVRVADIMSVMLNERYYIFDNEKLGRKVYTFIKRKDIDIAYGKAMNMVKNL